jgi:hypothetical protein
MNRILALIKQDQLRLEALNCVEKLNLPQCYLAAGFVRNLVWDHLHNYSQATVLNDVDVIYYDANESTHDKFKDYELLLNESMPQLNWQVRNQALMHTRNGDFPYESTIDAMKFWPEKETAVAIRKVANNDYECESVFGFESLFNLQVTHNAKRKRDIFNHRLKSKKWLIKWPKLKVVTFEGS